MICITDLQIISTLSYSYQFNDPLSLPEIKKRLINKDYLPRISALKVNDQPVKKRIKYLEVNGLIAHQDDCFILSQITQIKNQKKEVEKKISLKKQRILNSIKIRKDIQRLISLCIRLSWIKAIGITGSVAVESASRKDDLDFIVITTQNRLWLSRAILLIFALIIGKKITFWKHFFDKDLKDKWCFNLWLEVEHLQLPLSKQNFFSAFESTQIDWIYDTGGFEQEYFKQNTWIKKYFHSLLWFKESILSQDMKSIFEHSTLLNWLNKIVFLAESKHLAKKNSIPSSNLLAHQAWMHDDTSYRQYLDSWHQTYNSFCSALFKKTER